MRGGKKIRIVFYLLAAAGAALFTLLLIHQGAPQVMAAFASAGWWIAAVVIYHLAVPVLLDALAWWSLFPKSERLSLWQLFWMRWIGESVSTLVPSASCWRRCRSGAACGAAWRIDSDGSSERSRGHHAGSLRPDCFYAFGIGA